MNTLTRQSPGLWPTRISWALQVLLAAAFLGAAGSKLAGVPMMVDLFDKIGVGQWFRYFTAVTELVGAVALLIPRFTVYGALLLAITMLCALVVHLFVIHTSPIAAVVFLVLLLGIVWLRRNELRGSALLNMAPTH